MTNKNLGRLQKIELREAWLSESSEFTPWLAKEENLKLLSETIGIELECEAQEKEVGLFRADILCKDSATDSWVLIENQLEKTDHSHEWMVSKLEIFYQVFSPRVRSLTEVETDRGENE